MMRPGRAGAGRPGTERAGPASQHVPYQLGERSGRSRSGDRHKQDQAKPERTRPALQRGQDHGPPAAVVTRLLRRGYARNRDLPSRGLKELAAPC
jgi:hypothetical protein